MNPRSAWASGRATAAIGLLGGALGCGAAPDAGGAGNEVASTAASAVISCGTRPNGPVLRGAETKCREIERVFSTGATLGGAPLSLGLVGTSLYGAQNGALVATPQLVGARLVTSRGGSADPITMRIDAVRWVATGVAHHEYSMTAEVEPGHWENVCQDASGNPLMATLLPGVWGSGGAKTTATSDFTVTCPGSTIHKCMIDAGYVPWLSRNECRSGTCVSRSLDPYHQACVRMMRADYCGDGGSHTTSGTPVNGYDVLGVEQDDSATMMLEAEWGPAGARCVRLPRHVLDPNFKDGTTVIDFLRAHCPSRVPADLTTCGGAASTFPTATGFTTPVEQRALLRSEVYPELSFHPGGGAN